MLKTLLPLALLLASLCTHAQRNADYSAKQTVTLKHPVTSLAKMAERDLFPDPFFDDCGESVTSYGFNQPDTGFVIGNNSQNDAIFFQRLGVEPGTSFTVNSVSVAFVPSNVDAIADAFLQAYIYTDISDDGEFGQEIGASATVRVGDIVQPGTNQIVFTDFVFDEPVSVESDTFLVGIDFSDTYLQAEKGYIGIFQTEVGCGDGDNVVIIFPVDGGFGYSTLAASYEDFDSEMLVYATIETEESTATRQPKADYAAILVPNPTAGPARLTFDGSRAGRYTASLTDMTGRQLRSQEVIPAGAATRVEWQLDDLAPGVYLYHVDGPAGRQSGKVVVR